MTVRDLPTLNAALNATSAVLLLIGYALIREWNAAATPDTELSSPPGRSRMPLEV